MHTNKSVLKCQGQGHIASQYFTMRTMFVEMNEPNEKEKYDGYVEDDYEAEEGEIPGGELLMIRRMLGNQAKREESNQKENLRITFYCTILFHKASGFSIVVALA